MAHLLRKPTQKPMDPKLRELYIRVIDGQQGAIPLMHHIDFYRRKEEMLRWLIKENLTGTEFLFWFNYTCQRSPKLMAQTIFKAMDKDVTIRPIIFGKDLD